MENKEPIKITFLEGESTEEEKNIEKNFKLKDNKIN